VRLARIQANVGLREFMDLKRSLAPGDVVECAIDGIGILRNPVR